MTFPRHRCAAGPCTYCGGRTYAAAWRNGIEERMHFQCGPSFSAREKPNRHEARRIAAKAASRGIAAVKSFFAGNGSKADVLSAIEVWHDVLEELYPGD